MPLLKSFALVACLAGVVVGKIENKRDWTKNVTYCRTDPHNTPSHDIGAYPRSYGFLLYPAFEPLDIMGPLEALESLGRSYQIDVSFIAETLDPVTTAPSSAAMNAWNSSTFFALAPTHTFNAPPSDLEVLFVPGGAGSRSPNLNGTLAYLQSAYPNLKYLVTVCTGAWVAAKAGLLDGRRATTNKAAFHTIVAAEPQVYWVGKARWVVDGNIWTTSGVSAGIDGTLGFIECFFGSEVATNVINEMEYQWHKDPSWDPFAALYNDTSSWKVSYERIL